MHKNKGLLLCCIITVTAIAGLLGFGIYKERSSYQVFRDSGYILVSPDSTYSDDINNQIYFEKGTKYKKVYPKKVVLRNQEGEKIVVDEDSFVHYTDGSIGSFASGVMVDLNNLDDSVISHYGLSPESTMESAGSDFMLDNRGSSMSFQDFIWKIQDDKFLLVGNNIRIIFSEGNERVFSGYVEITYYDTGIIRIVTREGTWQTVSANCYAVLDNGIKLNLSNRTIVDENSIVKMSLEQMVIGSDDNIDIVPQEVKEQVIKAPKFEIETIDGTNGTQGIEGEAGVEGEAGQDGEAGEKGEKGAAGEEGKAGEKGEDGLTGADGAPGEPGSPGMTGSNGINGVNGVNGSNGANGAAGANGAVGEKGKSGDELATDPNLGGGSEDTRNVVLPVFDIKNITVTSTGVKVEISVKDEENRLDPTKTFVFQIMDNATGALVHQVDVDSSQRDFEFEYNGLLPNKEYRLRVAADYIVDNATYNRFFVNKLFITDALGLTIEKAYAQERSLAIRVKAAAYSNVVGADLQLTDSQGNAIQTKPINLLEAKQGEGSIVTFDNLTPNTKYNVKVINIEMGYDANLVAPPEFRNETFWTLKRIPLLGEPEVVVNRRSSCFDVVLKSVIDLDGAIVKYRYEIYEVGYDGSDTLVKKLYNTANDIMPVYVDNDAVKRGYNYRIRIVVECFDNEKNTEHASAFSDIVSLTGENFPIVLFEKDEDNTHHDKITGTLKINTNGASIKIDVNNPLIIEYKNSKGDVDTRYITDVPLYQLVDKDKILYTIPFTEKDLLAADNYIISVYGTVDLKDGAGERQRSLVGSVVTKTDTPLGFRAVWSQDVNATSPITFNISLVDATAESSAYEASTIEYIEINLYNGDETAVTHSAPVATYTMVGDKGDVYSSELADLIYGDKKRTLTEADFNIPAAAISSSKYTVEISSVRDYTRYGNEFTVTNNIMTFDKQATLPNLDTINKDDGLTVIPITLVNFNNYRDYFASNEEFEEALSKYSGYDAGTILGFEVTAKYFDNSAQLIKSFTYYAFEAKDYPDKPLPYDLYASGKEVAKKEVAVKEYGAVPKAIFLFGMDEAVNMSRGSKYIFTYRAELKTGAEYFPEVIDATAIIRSAIKEAPYQTPLFYFYPWTSDAGSVTWKYYIKALDTAAVSGSFYISGKGIVSDSSIKLNSNDNVKITDLQRGDIYTLKINTRRFKAIYNESFSNVLVSQYFDGTTEISSEPLMALRYTMTDDYTSNRYRIEVIDTSDNVNLITKVVALKVEVLKTDSVTKEKEITVPLKNVTGNKGLAYLPYTDIVEFLYKTVKYKISAVYDTGVSGFDSALGGERAIQILSGTGLGNYLTLNYNNSALFEDVSGNAKGSYFKITGGGSSSITGSITWTLDSLLVSSFKNGTMNLICNQTGAKIQNLSGQPNITLKKVEPVVLYVHESNDYLTEYTLNSMTPTVNLYNGDELTIDTTVSSAMIHWILQGHGPKMDLGEIQGNVMYMRLYKIGASGIKEETGIVKVINLNKNVTSYDTEFTDLESNTKYGVQIYYIHSGTGKEVYPINAYEPDKLPEANLYVFTTSGEVVITPDISPVTYVANSYMDKYLRISYSLSQTLGYEIQYSLVKKIGPDEYKVVLTSEQLFEKGIMSSPAVNREKMTDEKFYLQPGNVYWDEDGTTVYFPFDSTNYYLCIKPVSKTNKDITLGLPVYLQLKISKLNTPFYNINAIPGEEQVTFQISALDLGGVMVGDYYKIKIFNAAGEDITPAGYKDINYSIKLPQSFTVKNILENDYAVLKLYAVYDMDNTKRTSEGTELIGIKDIAYDDLDTPGKNYMKISKTGLPLSAGGYSLGTVQIMQSGLEGARLYFTNGVNLDKIKYIRYVVVNQAGGTVNYEDNFTLKGTSPNMYYEIAYKFTASGVYQLQFRFYDENMTQLDDLALYFYKDY